VNSADQHGQDGQKSGFDLALTHAVTDALEIPVIASGGVGNLQHLADGVKQAVRMRCWRPAFSTSRVHGASGKTIYGRARD